MQYNLIRNASFSAPISGGTGNKSLSYSELEKLMDGNTTSDGVSLTISDVLYLDVDLSQRIKIDGIRLYASNLTSSSSISFYYKNLSADSYSLLTTEVSTFYYTSISAPSAPRYFRTVVSGVSIELYELELLNEDYTVEFGVDGSLYAEYLDNTPIGVEGAPSSIAVFNNGTGSTPADAYVVIDYTGEVADEYVKISVTENGTYYGVNDGILIDDDQQASEYRWGMGVVGTGLSIVSDEVVSTISSGVYVSPIFELEEANNASYFLVEGTTSGTGSISYDIGSYNGTIRVRSSDTAPMVLNELCTAGAYTSQLYVFRRDLYTNTTTNIYIRNSNPAGGALAGINRRNGDIAVCWATYGAPNVYGNNVELVTRSGAIRWSKIGNNTYGRTGLLFSKRIEFDYINGFWGYGDYSQLSSETYHLLHFDIYGTVLANIYTSMVDFLYDFAVEWDGDGVWYTNQIDNLLVHKDNVGTTLQSIALAQPRSVCPTIDNGCWVIDNTNLIAYRYSVLGELLQSVSLGRTASRMACDYTNGFWYVSGNYVYHVTSTGIQDLSIILAATTKLYGTKDGCVAFNDTTNVSSFINKSTGTITRTWTVGDYNIMGTFSIDLDDASSYYGLDTLDIFPHSSDPVWGTVGSATWQEVSKDGYFLPKVKYHQAEITLRGTASLEKIIMPPAIKIESIQPQSYKNFYVKTDIPVGANLEDYESRIKTWWGV